MSSASQPTPLANTTTLSNGVVMPLVGFGCAGKLNHVPIAHAIRAGYRLFDTSQATEWYLEESLGEALRHSGVPLPREEVFLTTKLHPRDEIASTREYRPATVLRGRPFRSVGWHPTHCSAHGELVVESLSAS